MPRAHRPSVAPGRTSRCRRALLAAVAPVLAVAARPAAAQPAAPNPNNVYNGPSGAWSVGSNWTAGAAPAPGDAAQVGNATNALVVTFDATAGNLTNLASLTIDNAGTSTASVTLTQATNTLTTLTEYVAFNGNATLNLTGGVHQVTGAGSNSLFVAVNPGSVGNVNLGNVNLTVTDSTYVGIGGFGTFKQTGGFHFLNGNLTLGGEASGTVAAGTGIYTMTAGNLVAANLYVGLSGSGAFNHTNGAAMYGTVELGYLPAAIGVYNQAGGSIFTNNQITVGAQGLGTWNQSGGQHTAGGMVIAESANSAGTLNVTGGELDIATTLTVGAAGSAQVFHSGGTVTAARLVTSLTSGMPEPTYNLSGNGVLHVIRDSNGFNGIEYLAYNGDFTFTQDGGAHIVDGYLATAVQPGSRATYVLNAGTLSAAAQSWGYGSSANNTFTQNGGVNNASTFLTVGDQPGARGTYNFVAGTMNVNTFYTAAHGTGALNQSGGTANFTDFITGLDVPAKGTVTLSGGVLTVSDVEEIGEYGNGAFNQTGGTHNVSGTMTIGVNTGAAGVYNLRAGALAANTIVNNRNFNLFGGSATVSTLSGTAGATTLTGTNAAATVLKVGSISQGTLSIATNSKVTIPDNAADRLQSFVGTLTLPTNSGNATLDIGNGVVFFDSAKTPATTVKAALSRAYNYNKNIAFGLWDGPGGITSSDAVASVAAGNGRVTVAMVDGAVQSKYGFNMHTTLGGPSIPTNRVYVRAALMGDVNLDGVVNADDFSVIAQFARYGKTSPDGWINGDLNGDGVVNGDDISMIAQTRTFNSGISYGNGSGAGAGNGGLGAAPVASGSVSKLSAASVTGSVAVLGTTGDGIFDYVYNRATGDLKIQYDGDPAITTDTPLATLKINSAGGLINAAVAAAHRPANISAGTSTTTNTDINWSFLQVSDGTFPDGFDFGNILPTGLTNAAVLSDLTLFYARSGVIGQTPADLVVTPEPSTLALASFAAAATLLRRRRRRQH